MSDFPVDSVNLVEKIENNKNDQKLIQGENQNLEKKDEIKKDDLSKDLPKVEEDRIINEKQQCQDQQIDKNQHNPKILRNLSNSNSNSNSKILDNPNSLNNNNQIHNLNSNNSPINPNKLNSPRDEDSFYQRKNSSIIQPSNNFLIDRHNKGKNLYSAHNYNSRAIGFNSNSNSKNNIFNNSGNANMSTTNILSNYSNLNSTNRNLYSEEKRKFSPLLRRDYSQSKINNSKETLYEIIDKANERLKVEENLIYPANTKKRGGVFGEKDENLNFDNLKNMNINRLLRERSKSPVRIGNLRNLGNSKEKNEKKEINSSLKKKFELNNIRNIPSTNFNINKPIMHNLETFTNIDENDYFFKMFRNVIGQNKNLKVLTDKICKVNNRIPELDPDMMRSSLEKTETLKDSMKDSVRDSSKESINQQTKEPFLNQESPIKIVADITSPNVSPLPSPSCFKTFNEANKIKSKEILKMVSMENKNDFSKMSDSYIKYDINNEKEKEMYVQSLKRNLQELTNKKTESRKNREELFAELNDKIQEMYNKKQDKKTESDILLNDEKKLSENKNLDNESEKKDELVGMNNLNFTDGNENNNLQIESDDKSLAVEDLKIKSDEVANLLVKESQDNKDKNVNKVDNNEKSFINN